METVILKNGKEEAEGLVKVMMLTLSTLMNEQPTAFYDLVMKCRDSDYQWFGNNEKVCRDRNLLEAGGSIHDSIRNIILSGVEGEGLEMKLTYPIEKG